MYYKCYKDVVFLLQFCKYNEIIGESKCFFQNLFKNVKNGCCVNLVIQKYLYFLTSSIVLSFGKTQKLLVFRSLNRTFAL